MTRSSRQLLVDDGEEYFAAVPISNSSVLCVGSITRSEAARALEEGINIDGTGYYLYLAEQDSPAKPIEILASFSSNSAAEKLIKLFGQNRLAMA